MAKVIGQVVTTPMGKFQLLSRTGNRRNLFLAVPAGTAMPAKVWVIEYDVPAPEKKHGR